ncbi:MAG: fibronectin type III domain-containing protein [Armatimonadota bacterium]
MTYQRTLLLLFTFVVLASTAWAGTTTDWQLPIQVRASDTAAVVLFSPIALGTAAAASDDYKSGEDIPYPPSVPDPYTRTVSLAIVRAEGKTGQPTYAKDIRSPVRAFYPKDWKLVLATNRLTQLFPDVTFTWDVSDVPANIEITLKEDGGDFNGDGVTEYNMKAVTAYTINQGDNLQRRFTVTVVNTTPTVRILAPPTVADVTHNSAVINWQTEEPATSRVEYGETTAYGLVAESADAVTEHSVKLEGLQSNRTYHFRVISSALGKDAGVSDDQTFLTLYKPITISGLEVKDLKATEATLTWTTDIASTAKVEYGETTAYGQVVARVEPAASHAVTLTGLNPGTTYYFRITCEVPTEAVGIVSGQSFTTLELIEVIEQPSVKDITDTEATVAWTTNVATTGKVEWGLDASYGGGSVSDSQPTQTHSLRIKGLSPNSTYLVRVTNTAPGREPVVTEGITFKTEPAAITIVVAPSEVDLTSSSVVITWTTDAASDSRVEYGLDETYGSESGSVTLVTQHSVKLSGLTPGTTYHYRVSSGALNRTRVYSPDRTFSTPLAMSITSGPSAISVTGTTAVIVWSTDQPSDSKVEYGPTRAYGQQVSSDEAVTDHRITLENLEPDTTYNYRVISSAPGYETVASGNFMFSTRPKVKLTAAPEVKDITPTSATIVWATEGFATAEVEYGTDTTYGQKAITDKIGTAHSITLTNLKPGTEYHFRVISTAPNLEPLITADQTFQTPVPPIVITKDPVALSVTSDSATIEWETDVDSTSVVEYGLSMSYGETTTVEGLTKRHSVTLQNLHPVTEYHFRVISSAPGYQTVSSGDLVFKTTEVTIRITEGPTVANLTPFSAEIRWTTDVESDSSIEYGTTAQYTKALSDVRMVAQHVVLLTGLAGDTEYHYRVTSKAPGRAPAVSGDLTFRTPKAVLKFVTLPRVTVVTATSAAVSWSTTPAAGAVVDYGPTADYGLKVTIDDAKDTQQVTIGDLLPNTTYHLRVTARLSGYEDLVSGDVTFATAPAGVNYTFLRGFNVLDVANDNTGAIVDQTSELFAATVGNERDIAYDAKRGILYIARGNLTTGDGRENGQRGIAAVKLQPIPNSANPNAPGAGSNYTDTGLITAPVDEAGRKGLGFVQSIYFDPVSDALYVLSGEPEGGPSSTPRVYTAPGGTLGGAPEGGDTSAENSALRLLFQVTDDGGPNGEPLGGQNRGLCVRTVGGVTWVYMAMGQHADVWNNEGGTWHRVWSSALFPKDAVATDKLEPTANYVHSVTVDDEGNSYWAMNYVSPARIWFFPANASGRALEFSDTALGGSTTGVGLPVVIENDGTAIPPENLAGAANVEFVKEGDARYLMVSLLGANVNSRCVARVKIMGGPTEGKVPARVIDGFGPGASGVPQDPVLGTLTTKQRRAADGTKRTQPEAVGTDLSNLIYTTSPEPGKLWVNGFVKDKGQSIPTASAFEVAMAPARERVFITKAPAVVEVTADGVAIEWSTEQDTTANTVEYGRDTSYGLTAEATAGKVHRAVLTGLTRGATYHFRVISEAAGMDGVRTPDATFTFGGRPGDVNGDGKVSAADATVALRIAVKLVEPTEAQKLAADVYPKGNPDGKVTVSDVTLILRTALGLDTIE